MFKESLKSRSFFFYRKDVLEFLQHELHWWTPTWGRTYPRVSTRVPPAGPVSRSGGPRPDEETGGGGSPGGSYHSDAAGDSTRTPARKFHHTRLVQVGSVTGPGTP